MSTNELTATILDGILAAHNISVATSTSTFEGIEYLTGTLYGVRFWANAEHGVIVGGRGKLAGTMPRAFAAFAMATVSNN